MSYLPSNRELLNRYRAGDRRALEQLYSHYVPGLARMLRGGFEFQLQGQRNRFAGYGVPLELSDAIQEVFSRAFSESARFSYDGISPFAGYLAGIAQNIVVDDFRKRQTAANSLGVLTSAPGPEPSTPPDIAVEEGEAARLLALFAASLDSDARPLYQARFIDHLTQEEAARSLGISRIQLRRGELKLRRALLELLKRNGFLEDVRITGWGLAGIRPSLAGRRRDP